MEAREEGLRGQGDAALDGQEEKASEEQGALGGQEKEVLYVKVDETLEGQRGEPPNKQGVGASDKQKEVILKGQGERAPGGAT